MEQQSNNNFSEFLFKNCTLLSQFAVFISTFYFIILSYYCYWADSEIWALTLSNRLFTQNPDNYSLYFKIPFYFLLKLFYFIPGDNVSLLLIARIVFMAIGLGNLFLTWNLAKNIFQNIQIAYLSVLLLIASSAFINQGFRLRSDILSVFWNLLFLNFVFHFTKIKIRQDWKRYFIYFFVLNCLLLVTTPKAIYFYISQGCFAILLVKKVAAADRRIYLKTVLLSFLLPISAGLFFLAISAVFSMSGGSNRVFIGYYSAWLYFKNAFLAIDINNLESEKLFFIKQFLIRNLELVTMFLSPMILIPINYFQKNYNQALLTIRIQSFILLLLASTYNDWLPFFIASLLPILSISAAGFIDELSNNIANAIRLSPVRKNIFLIWIYFFSTIFLLAKASYFFHSNISGNTNLLQRSTIHSLEKYFSNYRNAKFYDVIGLLPRDNTIYKFAGPGQDYENRIAAKTIQEIKPDFLIYIKKMSYLEPEITNLIESNYADLGQGLYGKALRISLSEKDIGTMKYLGKNYYKLKSTDLLAKLDENIPSLFKERLYFYTSKSKAIGELQQEVLFFPAAGMEPINLKYQSIEPKDLWGEGYILIAEKKFDVKVSIYSPIQLAHLEPMLFLFSFDSLY